MKLLLLLLIITAIVYYCCYDSMLESFAYITTEGETERDELRRLHKEIQDLEDQARRCVDLKNDGPGGSRDVETERIALENIDNRIKKLTKRVNEIIDSESTNNDETHKLYASNPMICLPNQIGTPCPFI